MSGHNLRVGRCRRAVVVGKKLFRGSTKSVARQRFPQIRDYVDKMKRLPYEILSSDMVRTFFSPHPEDLVRSRSVELDDKYGEDVGKRERSRTLPSEGQFSLRWLYIRGL